ncbi:hypothetical protein BDM02DRAFT_3157319 [Thelephora ganbajun]|uniref:Uncharacterized protein n=1 Tax=Thelephora ganbajun TaxID=370292 RepID=A0ACB6Z2H1_THEGA|nr:hypothetical protein BDM02DRAFT_3157319 [Thelephora ganbajun]
MDRRRGISARPASTEEVECWSHARSSINTLNGIYSNPGTVETIGRVNRLISSWPSNDTLPAEGFEGVKPVYKKLLSGLQEVKNNAEKEARAIGETMERLDVLIALRKASESHATGQSPAVTSTPATPVVNSLQKITLPARNSVGPGSNIPFSREPKARREALAAQLPLQEGRKVAFHPPSSSGTNGPTDESTWILAVVTRCINQDKNRYVVQDAEPQEDGQPGALYNTTLRSIIPLPDPNAPPNSASHQSAYPVFPAGATVMALYPDTSCFYRAEVLASPSDMHPAGRGAQSKPMYKLKFEDDGDQEHSVSAQLVVEWPG